LAAQQRSSWSHFCLTWRPLLRGPKDTDAIWRGEKFGFATADVV
jgi:hypothetical protein